VRVFVIAEKRKNPEGGEGKPAGKSLHGLGISTKQDTSPNHPSEHRKSGPQRAPGHQKKGAEENVTVNLSDRGALEKSNGRKGRKNVPQPKETRSLFDKRNFRCAVGEAIIELVSGRTTEVKEVENSRIWGPTFCKKSRTDPSFAQDVGGKTSKEDKPLSCEKTIADKHV